MSQPQLSNTPPHAAARTIITASGLSLLTAITAVLVVVAVGH